MTPFIGIVYKKSLHVYIIWARCIEQNQIYMLLSGVITRMYNLLKRTLNKAFQLFFKQFCFFCEIFNFLAKPSFRKSFALYWSTRIGYVEHAFCKFFKHSTRISSCFWLISMHPVIYGFARAGAMTLYFSTLFGVDWRLFFFFAN